MEGIVSYGTFIPQCRIAVEDDGAHVEGEILNVLMGVRLTELKKKGDYGYVNLMKGKRVRDVIRRLRKSDWDYREYGYKWVVDEST